MFLHAGGNEADAQVTAVSQLGPATGSAPSPDGAGAVDVNQALPQGSGGLSGLPGMVRCSPRHHTLPPYLATLQIPEHSYTHPLSLRPSKVVLMPAMLPQADRKLLLSKAASLPTPTL